MTDLEAIRQYRAAERYRDGILSERVPWIFDRDPEALAQYQKIIMRGFDRAESVMMQAKKAIERLPRPILRETLTYRYLRGFTEEETADAMFYSVSTIRRYQRQAEKYLETGE